MPLLVSAVRMNVNSNNILWVDCTAAASVGALVLALSPWLSSLYGLPLPFLWFLGAINLTYGCYSFSLAARPHRGLRSLHVLIVGNGLWAILCLAFASLFWTTATAFGIASLLAEAIVVGTLARLEWQWRDALVTAREPPHPH
ncbi:MAG: hypothetical protein GVY15_13605 [Bacteroidetes bacterium]|nr:hypothetical protein [Bacteroidota bacterium]